VTATSIDVLGLKNFDGLCFCFEIGGGMTEKLALIVAHVEKCATCCSANKRVNDFCEQGKLLFFDYARDTAPNRITEHTLTDEQYARLVEETRRRQQQGERN
jgi:hypothetical protein